MVNLSVWLVQIFYLCFSPNTTNRYFITRYSFTHRLKHLTDTVRLSLPSLLTSTPCVPEFPSRQTLSPHLLNYNLWIVRVSQFQYSLSSLNVVPLYWRAVLARVHFSRSFNKKRNSNCTTRLLAPRGLFIFCQFRYCLDNSAALSSFLTIKMIRCFPRSSGHLIRRLLRMSYSLCSFPRCNLI